MVEQNTPAPEPGGAESTTGGGFWTEASTGAKAVVIIGALILVAGLIWGLISMMGGGNKPTEPSITPIPTVATVAPPTAEPGVASLVAIRDANIYGGPGTEYPQIGLLQSGLAAEVIGSNQDKSWWAIKFPSGPNGTGWLANGDVKTQNVENVPILQAPPLPTATPVVITDWKGEYFDNPDLKGQPVLIRNDQDINFDWGAAAPAPELPDDHYSVRWSRKAPFENSDYLFTVDVEGGVRLWLDGRMLIDDWVASGHRTLTAQSGELDAGDHDLRVDYFKSGGVGKISVSWRPVAAEAPVAVIDLPNQPIVAGEPIQFRGERSTAAQGHEIVTYEWDFGDGAGSNDVNPTYTYSKAGVYTVSLTVTDDLGQTGKTKVGITVNEPQKNPPVAIIAGPAVGQVGDRLAFSGKDSHGDTPIKRYEWDFGDGQTAVGEDVTHTYQQAGQYIVNLTVTDQDDQQGRTSLTVTIADVPTPAPQPTVGPTATPPGQEILGAWSMVSWAQGRQAPIELLPDTHITLVLDADGHYRGHGGCNTYQGTYQILGPEQIAFGAMSQSQKICDQPVMQQETEYFTLLLKVNKFEVDDSQLNMETRDNWTLFFNRAP